MIIKAQCNGNPIEALIDSGSWADTISKTYAVRNSLEIEKLPAPRKFKSVNGGKITCLFTTGNLEIKIADRIEHRKFLVLPGAKRDITLGKPWLLAANPIIDWRTGKVRFQVPQGESGHSKSVWVSWRLAELQEDKQDIPEQYQKYKELFDYQHMKLPKHKKWDCTIPLEEGKVPGRSPIYELSEEEQELLKVYLKENLDNGFISKSKSALGHPILFAKKPGGGLRLCVDFRKTNAITLKIGHPVPIIRELRAKVRKAKIFTKLDLSRAYNLIRMAPGEEWKTAFVTREGVYEYNVMPFGLTNAPSHFQSVISEILEEFLDLFVIVYLDDILIYSETENMHEEHVHQVLEALQENDMKINTAKCSFSAKEVKYLGYVLRPGSVSTDPEYTRKIREWKTPSNKKEVQSFLGFAGFYQKLVPKYSKVVLPLIGLTAKGKKWDWQGIHEESFALCKKLFTTDPILQNFQHERETIVETDASDGAIGACLTQLVDGVRLPVAYASRKLKPAEINYDTHDKELLAVRYACEEWRPYLQGTEKQIKIETDHKNLQYFLTSKVITRRQARWLEYLMEYNLVFVHVPGDRNGRADALSRLSEYGTPEKTEKAILRESQNGYLLASLTPEEETLSEEQEFKKCYDDSEIEMLLDPTEYGLITEHGVLYHGKKLYVPKRKEKEKILETHQGALQGHPGINATWEIISKNYYFPKMRDKIRKVVMDCNECNQNKILRERPHGLPQPLEVAEAAWDTVTMDFVVKLPPATDGVTNQTYDSILTVVDKLTKYAIFAPCSEAMTAEQFAQLFLRTVVQEHGTPAHIVTDRDKIFVSKFWNGLLQGLQVRSKMSSAYHPETDGQSERMNQVIEQYLRIFANETQDNWVRLLPTGMMAYNTMPLEKLGLSPYFMNYGREMRKPELKQHSNNPAALAQIEEMQTLHEQCIQDLKIIRAKEKQKKDGLADDIHKGDKVYLDIRNIEFNKVKKLDHLRIGPLLVEEKISETAFRIKLPPGRKIHPVFHAKLLKKAPSHLPIMKKWPTRPVKKKEYEVEAILRKEDDLYLVKWKGYGEEENTWEPVTNLHNCKKLLQQYDEG